MRLVLFIALLCAAPAASALTLVADCTDWFMHPTDKGLEFRCHSKPDADPWLTLAGCLTPTATRSRSTGYVTVTCNSGNCAGQKFIVRSQ